MAEYPMEENQMSSQTQTNTNEHYDRAKSRLHNGTNNEVIRAQAEATLALAYEQRTANLIALFADSGHNGPAEGISYDQLVKTIRERLGL